MAHMSCDEFAEFERLHKLFQNKCEEEIKLLEDLTRAKLDAQHLRLRLAASGIQDASLIPKLLQCGGHREDTSVMEIRSLIEWLREQCVFTETTVFEVGAEVKVGVHDVFLGRMISWLLRDGEMKLSIPQNLEHEIRNLLRPGQLAQRVLQDFATQWEMVGAEVAAEGNTRPAIFLIHRETKEAIVVGAWPVVQPVVKAVFDPDEYFQSLCVQPAGSCMPAEDPHIVPALLPASKDDFNGRRDHAHRAITKSQSADQLH